MNLLIFAHKKEALAFFKTYFYGKTSVQNLFLSKDHALLITGEGLVKALFKTSETFGFFLSEKER